MDQAHSDRTLVAAGEPGTRNEKVAECYTVHYPDVLEVSVAGPPGGASRKPVELDGRIDLGDKAAVKVEGRTVPDIARLVAAATGASPAHVHVRVVEFNSQSIYLFSQGVGLQRAVSYQGPESVLELLRRTGGLPRGAAPDEVYVVRPHIVEDRQPEVFHIKLHDVLVKNDKRTNLRLEPFDQVYIGETRQSSLEKCVPPYLRPIYQTVCGLGKPDELPPKDARSSHAP
jgi:protein involved in polysaccharide export with SLBB domain